jgi:hypothetical protein
MPTPDTDLALAGRLHYVSQLVYPGACAALAFDGFGHELGNGWFDVTARIAGAADDAWLPVQIGDVHAELLHDLGRRMLGPLRAGDIMREAYPQGGYVYGLHDGECWAYVDTILAAADDPVRAAQVRSLDRGKRAAD